MVAAVLLLCYALVFTQVLSQGINYEFVTWLYQWLLIVIPICAAYLIYRRYAKRETVNYIHHAEAFSSKDLFLLLLPMAPIVRYIVLNQDVLSGWDSIMVFAIFLAVASVISFLVPAVVCRLGSRRVCMILGLSFSFILFDMASIAFKSGWYLSGNPWTQVTLFAGFFTMYLIIYIWRRKILIISAVAFFIVSTSSSLIAFEEIRSHDKGMIVNSSRSDIFEYTAGKALKRKPDIFLLVYDSYVENETMVQYGIDNNTQEEYLTRNGFHIYRGTYSLGLSTKVSMNSVLDLEMNSEGTAYSGNGAVQQILKNQAYETIGIFPSDYFFRIIGSSYHQSYPIQELLPYQPLVQSIFEGEFRFDRNFSSTNYAEYVSKKQAVLSSRADKPRFLYAHSSRPGHSQNSGRALGNEIEMFKKNLVKANAEMREDIEAVKQYNPRALVIICGDHGPNLMKKSSWTGSNNQYGKSEITRLDIQDRFGSFMAIRWPKNANIDHDQINILQDIFPVVFAYLYDDASIVDARMEQLTVGERVISGVRVRDGIIEGGIDDGRLLFDSMKDG